MSDNEDSPCIQVALLGRVAAQLESQQNMATNLYKVNCYGLAVSNIRTDIVVKSIDVLNLFSKTAFSRPFLTRRPVKCAKQFHINLYLSSLRFNFCGNC